MTMARPSLLGRFVAVASLLGACWESPYGPAPSVTTCGRPELPCELTCETSCASSAISAATGCMMTLQGELDDARLSCSFGDGSSVLFSSPVPASAAELASADWQLIIRRRQVECLALSLVTDRRQSGVVLSTLEVRSSLGTYLQRITRSEPQASGQDARAATDSSLRPDGPLRRDAGRPRDAGRAQDGQGSVVRVEMTCPDGRSRASDIPLRCSCQDGRCLDPLLQLIATRASSSSALEMSLSSNESLTPLFTCR